MAQTRQRIEEEKFATSITSWDSFSSSSMGESQSVLYYLLKTIYCTHFREKVSDTMSEVPEGSWGIFHPNILDQKFQILAGTSANETNTWPLREKL